MISQCLLCFAARRFVSHGGRPRTGRTYRQTQLFYRALPSRSNQAHQGHPSGHLGSGLVGEVKAQACWRRGETHRGVIVGNALVCCASNCTFAAARSIAMTSVERSAKGGGDGAEALPDLPVTGLPAWFCLP